MEETAKGICISTTWGCNLVTLRTKGPRSFRDVWEKLQRVEVWEKNNRRSNDLTLYNVSPRHMTWWIDICVAGFVLKSNTESVDKLADSQSPHWGTKRGTLDNAHKWHPRKTHARDSFAASRDEVIIVRSPYEGKDFATKPWFWALLHLINLLPESKWKPC